MIKLMLAKKLNSLDNLWTPYIQNDVDGNFRHPVPVSTLNICLAPLLHGPVLTVPIHRNQSEVVTFPVCIWMGKLWESASTYAWHLMC